jgi:hypothetical protein
MMKVSNAVIWLSGVVIIFLAVYANMGLFSTGGQGVFQFTTLRGQTVEIYGNGVYRLDTTFFAAGFRGNDVVTIFLVLPLMILSLLLYKSGSRRGGLLLAGSLAYVLYNSFSLGTSAAYNPLFLLYTASFSASLFALLKLWAQFDFDSLREQSLPGMPGYGIAIFLFVCGGMTALLWLSDLIPPLAHGKPPALLGSYTTAITYFVDLAIMTPLCFQAARWLLLRDGRGMLLGFVLLELLAMMGFIVLGQTIFQIRAGIIFSLGQFIGMISSWVVMGSTAMYFGVKMLRNISEKLVTHFPNLSFRPVK